MSKEEELDKIVKRLFEFIKEYDKEFLDKTLKKLNEKAYYDLCIKRIHRIRKTCDVSQAIVCDEIEQALKEELTVDNNSGNKKEKH